MIFVVSVGPFCSFGPFYERIATPEESCRCMAELTTNSLSQSGMEKTPHDSALCAYLVPTVRPTADSNHRYFEFINILIYHESRLSDRKWHSLLKIGKIERLKDDAIEVTNEYTTSDPERRVKVKRRMYRTRFGMVIANQAYTDAGPHGWDSKTLERLDDLTGICQ